VELSRAAGGQPVEELRDRVRRQVDGDQELVVDPRFFLALTERFGRLARVRVLPKRGSVDNELTRFRYDVLLTVAGAAEDRRPGVAGEWLDWAGDRLSLPALRERLAAGPDLLDVRGVPNARVRAAAGAARRLATATGSAAGLRAELAAVPAGGAVDPEQLHRLGEETGYQVELDWSGHGPDGELRMLARRLDEAGRPLVALPEPERAEPRPWQAYVNGAGRRRVRRLLPALRAALAESLPDYMIPSAFVVLEGLPLTPNGKIDRTALPAPDSSRRELQSVYVAPRGPVEEVVAGIWAEALTLDRVGAGDDFFALGGHSLLSTQVMARIREAFGVDVPLHRLFAEPTVAALARTLAEGGRGAEVDRTAELLLELGALSDDEVEQALSGAGEGTRP